MSEIKNPQLGIVINDGSVRVPISNEFGQEIGVFFFRPTDIGMIDRYNKIAADFEKITEPLENVNINPDGTTDESDEVQTAARHEATTRLYEACDYLFGGNMSEAFFGKMHPFSIVDGKFYCEHALGHVADFISDQFGKEVAKVNKRVAKYTHGYAARTGKHKGGKK